MRVSLLLLLLCVRMIDKSFVLAVSHVCPQACSKHLSTGVAKGGGQEMCSGRGLSSELQKD